MFRPHYIWMTLDDITSILQWPDYQEDCIVIEFEIQIIASLAAVFWQHSIIQWQDLAEIEKLRHEN